MMRGIKYGQNVDRERQEKETPSDSDGVCQIARIKPQVFKYKVPEGNTYDLKQITT